MKIIFFLIMLSLLTGCATKVETQVSNTNQIDKDETFLLKVLNTEKSNLVQRQVFSIQGNCKYEIKTNSVYEKTFSFDLRDMDPRSVSYRKLKFGEVVLLSTYDKKRQL